MALWPFKNINMIELYLKFKLSLDNVFKKLSAYRYGDEYAKHRIIVNLIYLFVGLIYTTIYSYIHDNFYHIKAFMVFTVFNLTWIFYRHIKRKRRIQTKEKENEKSIIGIVKVS